MALLSPVGHAGRPTLTGAVLWGFGQSPADPRVIYAASGGAVLYRSTDRGHSWYPLRVDRRAASAQPVVDPRNADHLWLVSQATDDAVVQSRDGGRTWKDRSWMEAVGPGGAKVWIKPRRLFVDALDARRIWWAVASEAPSAGQLALYRSLDAGQTWVHSLTLQSPADWRLGVEMAQSGEVAYVMQGGVIWRTDVGGVSWTKVHQFDAAANADGSAAYPSQLLALPNGELVVRRVNGRRHVSRDGGQSWHAADNGFEELNEITGEDSSPLPMWGMGEWCHAERAAAAPGVLIAQCTGNHDYAPHRPCIHVSQDAGRTWTPPRQLTCTAQGLPQRWSPTALWVDVADSRRILVSWIAGGVYRSEDGGMHWQPSGEGTLFRRPDGDPVDWTAVTEPPLIRAVLYRDRPLLRRLLSDGVPIQTPGTYIRGVLGADLWAGEFDRNTFEDSFSCRRPMWELLRALGARPPLSSESKLPHYPMAVNAWKLGRMEVLDDLIRMGYDWSQHEKTDSDKSEIAWVLSAMAEHSQRDLLNQYVRAGHFVALRETLRAVGEHVGALEMWRLANEALRAGKLTAAQLTHWLPVDTPARIWAEDRDMARPAFLQMKKGGRMDPEFGAVIGRSCDLPEADWYAARGVKVDWSSCFDIDADTDPSTNVHMHAAVEPMRQAQKLAALDELTARGKLTPELWTDLLMRSETRLGTWVQRSRIYRDFQQTGKPQPLGSVGIDFGVTLEDDEYRKVVFVGDLYPGYSAVEAGLQEGDLITHIDGRVLKPASVKEQSLGAIGSVARLTVQRGGKIMQIPVIRRFVLSPDEPSPSPPNEMGPH